MTNAPPAGEAARLLPWWRSYRRAWLPRDLLAGVTVAAYLVPQVMGYAAIAGLPPVTGLWASLLPLVVYAFVGSSPQLSIGPESTTALLAALTLSVVASTDPDRLLATAGVLALLTGLVCIVGRLLRAGYLSRLLSRPILVGYMLGIAVLMISSQLDHLTGLSVPRGTLVAEVGYVAARVAEIEVAPLVMGVALVALMLAGRRRFPRLPWTLLAMLLAAGVTYFARLDRFGIEVVGEIPAGLPTPSLPLIPLADVPALLPAALGLAVVGYSDTMLTAQGFAAKIRHRIDPNRELVALGLANIAAGVSSGFPISSSASRTAIAHALNVRTQLYSVIAAGMVVLTVTFGRPVLAAFPWAGLAAVVVYAATRLVEIAELRRMARFRASELTLALITTLAVVLLGVLWGVAAAVALSLVDLLRRIALPHDAVLGIVPGMAGMHDVRDYPEGRQVPGLVIYRYDSPLFFANASDLVDRALRSVDQARPPARWFVLDAEANSNLDLTAADALEDLRDRLEQRGVVFATAHLRSELRAALTRTGWVARVGEDRLFATMPTAVAAYQQWLATQQDGDEGPAQVPTNDS